MAIKTLADNCVYCGLCTQYCPTYRENQEESESPRGRVIGALHVLNDTLASTEVFERHINNCLFCGACERACPAKVPVLEVLSLVKSKFKLKEAGELRWLSKHPKLFRWLSLGGVLLKKLRLDSLPGFKNRLKLLPNKIVKFKAPTGGAEVALFTGCARNIDHGIPDILDVFGFLNINLKILDNNCCGALHAHAGDITYAKMLAEENLKSLFKNQTVIYINPGCRDYMQKLETSSNKVFEASEYLADSGQLDLLKPESLRKTVAVHIPCSQQYNPFAQNQIQQLLSLIPELKIKFLQTRSCCGASKLYSDMENSFVYAKPYLEEIKAIKPDYLLSCNLACRLNLKAALKQEMINVKIMHPLTLLSQQLCKEHITR